MSYYCNTKDRIPDYLKSHVVHEFYCPACNVGYIGKTDQNLETRIKEYCGLDKNSPIFNHLGECNFYQYTLTLHSFPCDSDVTLTNPDIQGGPKKAPYFGFHPKVVCYSFFSIFFRWCRQQAWEILLTPVWIQVDAILHRSG